MLELRAASLVDTNAIAAAVAVLCRPGDLVVLAGEMGAGKTAFAKGFGAALGVTEPITSPTFTLVHTYDLPPGNGTGAAALHHADLYRLDRTAEVADLALDELAENAGIVLVEWGDVVDSLFGDHLMVHLEPGCRAGRRRRSDGRVPMDRALRQRIIVGSQVESTGRRVRGVPMLILGIETATERVSVAVGGHEGVIGLFEVTKGRRHVETLVPAIEFVLQQADIDLEEISVVAVDVGPGLFTGMRVGLAAAKAIALALRIPMIGISSLDLLAFPSRHSDRVVVPVVDARKGEVFYAMYRQVPGGLQQVAEPRSGRSTNSSPTCSPGARTRSVSATGHCATARRSSTASTARSAGTRIRRPHRWCSSPTLVRCARSG
jgi:tRNA threonylcarbamoyl adenosine modification protein YeaZ/tRNA threonylcarbamoyl adenosine modification protein YjeE